MKDKEAQLKASEQKLHDEFERMRKQHGDEKKQLDDKRNQLASNLNYSAFYDVRNNRRMRSAISTNGRCSFKLRGLKLKFLNQLIRHCGHLGSSLHIMFSCILFHFHSVHILYNSLILLFYSGREHILPFKFSSILIDCILVFVLIESLFDFCVIKITFEISKYLHNGCQLETSDN